MRAVLSNLSSLMMASFVVQASNAAITTMVGIIIAARGGTQSDISLIAGCYSVGFVLGCFAIPSQANRLGLIRAYAEAAAILTISIVGLELLSGTAQWAFLRFIMGASVAAVLAVSDVWINGRLPQQIRGKVIAIYSIILGLGSVSSQLILIMVDVETEGLVLVFAILMNLAVVLVATTSAEAPSIPRRPAGKIRLVTITSKTAGLAAFVSGFSSVAFVTITPFYLTEHGIPSKLVAVQLFALYLGRLLSQWPVGFLSDRFDRRTVLIGLSTSVAVLMIALLIVGPNEGKVISGEFGIAVQGLAFLLAMALGAVMFPIYSVASSLAFDRADEQSMLGVSTTLLMIHSIGSIAGPFTVMLLSAYLADNSLMVTVSFACAVLALIAIFRRSTIAAPADHTPASFAPEGSLEMAQAVAEITEKEKETN